MRRWERRTFHAAALVVILTGAAYLWMKYFVESADPFAVVNHPWESAMLHLHVLASPVLLLVFGIIFNSHVVKKLGISRLPNRKSGLASLALFATMAITGYLLQVITSDALLRGLVIVHVGSGALFATVYGAHLVISARLARRRPASTAIREVA